MKFTIGEWASIKRALGTALDEAELLVIDLEAEIMTTPTKLSLKDYLDAKMLVTELEDYIARIESWAV